MCYFERAYVSSEGTTRARAETSLLLTMRTVAAVLTVCNAYDSAGRDYSRCGVCACSTRSTSYINTRENSGQKFRMINREKHYLRMQILQLLLVQVQHLIDPLFIFELKTLFSSFEIANFCSLNGRWSKEIGAQMFTEEKRKNSR